MVTLGGYRSVWVCFEGSLVSLDDFFVVYGHFGLVWVDLGAFWVGFEWVRVDLAKYISQSR